MLDAAYTDLLPAREVARTTLLATAANGLRWASYGYTEVPSDTIQHIVEAVPQRVADALQARAYYFVPLAISESPDGSETGGADTEIAPGYTLDLSDRATCHRNVLADGVECTFISARLMQDRFALAFEFFINIGHQFVDSGAVPMRFRELAWAQARADVRGETSQDAWESRKRAIDAAPAPPPLSSPLPDPGSGSGSGSSPGLGSSPVAGNTHSLFAITEVSPRRRASEQLTFNNSSASPHHAAEIRPTDDLSDPARITYFEAAFADTLAIYMLSLAIDLDYADLREREYPLLAPPALAERLRLAAELFPPPANYEFAIRYRRRR